MAIQQVLTIYLNLKGDGASSAFSFALQNLYQFENGIAVPFGGAGVVPTAVAVNNPPVPVTSVVIDANGNITLTTTSALPASVFTFQLDLTFNSGSSTSTSATQTTNVTVVGSSSVTIGAGSAVIGHVIADSGSTTVVTGNVTVVQATGTNLHAVIDSGSTTAVTQATGTNLHMVVDSGTITTLSTLSTITNAVTVVGSAASGTAKSGNPVQTGGVFNTTQPTVTTGQAVESQSTARGAQIVATGVDTFTVTANQGGAPWTQNLTQVAGVALGAPSAYGTGPGAVNVLGVNAFVTNAVTISGNIGISAASNTDRVSTGSITTTQSIAVGIASASSVIIQVAGTWTGTLVFEYSADNATFISLPVYPVPSGTSVTSTTANGVWMAPVGGFSTVRVRGNSVASGTASINIESSMGGLTFQMVQPTAANLNATVVVAAGSAVIGHVITDTGSTTAVTGTVTTSDTNLVAQGSTTSGQKGPLIQGAVTTAAPTYTTAQTSPLSLDTAGNLRVAGTFAAGALPDATTAISLTTVAQTAQILCAGRNSFGFILTSVGTGGTVQAEGSIDGTNFFSIDVWSEALETWISNPIAVTGQWWFEPIGSLNAVRVKVTAITSGTITGNLIASATVMGTFEYQTSPGQAVAPNIVSIGGSVTTAAPTYTTATANSLSLDTSGNLRTTQTAGTSTLTSVASSASTVSLLAANTSRKGYSVFNESTAILYIAEAATSSLTAYTVQVAPGGYYESPFTCPLSAISGIWKTANGNARITERT